MFLTDKFESGLWYMVAVRKKLLFHGREQDAALIARVLQRATGAKDEELRKLTGTIAGCGKGITEESVEMVLRTCRQALGMRQT